MLKIHLIIALSRNNVIGYQNRLPWKSSVDLKRFKELTTNSPIIMGRKTWDSLPKKPLPNRKNIVISKQLDYNLQLPSEASHFYNLEHAVEWLKENSFEKAFIIGGAQIYNEAMKQKIPDILNITYVEDNEIIGDTYFDPFVYGDNFEIASVQYTKRAENDSHDVTFIDVIRCKE